MGKEDGRNTSLSDIQTSFLKNIADQFLPKSQETIKTLFGETQKNLQLIELPLLGKSAQNLKVLLVAEGIGENHVKAFINNEGNIEIYRQGQLLNTVRYERSVESTKANISLKPYNLETEALSLQDEALVIFIPDSQNSFFLRRKVKLPVEAKDTFGPDGMALSTQVLQEQQRSKSQKAQAVQEEINRIEAKVSQAQAEAKAINESQLQAQPQVSNVETKLKTLSSEEKQRIRITKDNVIKSLKKGIVELATKKPELQRFNNMLPDQYVELRQLGDGNPEQYIPVLLIHSNPERADEQIIHKLFNFNRLEDNTSGLISFRINCNTRLPANKNVIEMKLEKDKDLSMRYVLDVITQFFPGNTQPALLIPIDQSNPRITRYHPVIINLPVNFRDIFQPNGWMISDAELKVDQAIEKPLDIVKTIGSDAATLIITGGVDSRPHLSEKERTIYAICIERAKKINERNYDRLKILEGKLAKILANEKRKKSGNLGKATRTELKTLSKKKKNPNKGKPGYHHH